MILPPVDKCRAELSCRLTSDGSHYRGRRDKVVSRRRLRRAVVRTGLSPVSCASRNSRKVWFCASALVGAMRQALRWRSSGTFRRPGVGPLRRGRVLARLWRFSWHSQPAPFPLYSCWRDKPQGCLCFQQFDVLHWIINDDFVCWQREQPR